MESTQTDIIDIAPPSASGITNLELAMGAGTLTINPGAKDRLVQGSITYNVPELKPTVTTNNNTVRIEQEKSGFVALRNNVKNDWDLRLGTAPLTLTLSIGAAKVRLELGGLALASLAVAQGASDLALTLSQPNLIELDTLRFHAGAAKSVLRGLGHLNARKLEFKGGAGVLSLDFDGALHRDLAVSITASAGSVVVAVPSGVPAEASLVGVMTTVNTRGAWTHAHQRYQTPGNGPRITVDLKMSVGKLELRNL